MLYSWYATALTVLSISPHNMHEQGLCTYTETGSTTMLIDLV